MTTACFVIFFLVYGLLFMEFVLPPVRAEYGNWAGTVAVALYALFALGCAFFGNRFRFLDKWRLR
jgi:hypothetical protein